MNKRDEQLIDEQVDMVSDLLDDEKMVTLAAVRLALVAQFKAGLAAGISECVGELEQAS